VTIEFSKEEGTSDVEKANFVEFWEQTPDWKGFERMGEKALVNIHF
jgi:hypothetical protein